MPDLLTSQIFSSSNPSSSKLLPAPFISSYKHELITHLGIPSQLTGSGDVSLPLAYQKYRAFLIAFQTYEGMVKANTWMIA